MIFRYMTRKAGRTCYIEATRARIEGGALLFEQNVAMYGPEEWSLVAAFNEWYRLIPSDDIEPSVVEYRKQQEDIRSQLQRATESQLEGAQ